MHELSIAQNVLQIALEQAQTAADGRVTEITLQVGDLTQVFVDSLKFCFEVCAQGTRAEGAMLNIMHVPAVGVCRACGERSEIELPVFMCRACVSFDIELASGDELLVESIVMENADEDQSL